VESKTTVTLPGPNWAITVAMVGAPIVLGVFLIWLSQWFLETFGEIIYTSDITGRVFIPDSSLRVLGITFLVSGIVFAGYMVKFISSFIRSSRLIGPNEIVFPVVRNGKGAIKTGEFRSSWMRSRSLPHFMTARLGPDSFELWDGQSAPMWSVRWAEFETATIIKAVGPPFGPLLTLTGPESTTLIAVSVVSGRNLVLWERNRTTLATLRSTIDRLIHDAK
jgi:hypothetical protein